LPLFISYINVFLCSTLIFFFIFTTSRPQQIVISPLTYHYINKSTGHHKKLGHWPLLVKKVPNMLLSVPSSNVDQHLNLKLFMVGWLEFNVPFQHKYGYIRDDETVHDHTQQ